MLSSSNLKIASYFQKSYKSKDILFLAFILLCFNIAVNAYYSFKGMGYPYTSFLITPLDRFGDFFKVIDAFHLVDTWDGFNPYDGKVNLYSRPAAAVYYIFFSKLIIYVGNKNIVYGLLCFTVIVSIILICNKTGNSLRTSLLVAVSYPMIFAFDRGNFAFAVFLFVLIALVTNNTLLSTFLIALVSSLKFTPLIFILLLLVREPFTIKKTIKIVGFTVIWVFIINYISVLIISQTFGEISSASNFGDELRDYSHNMIEEMGGLAFGSSLYMPLVWIATKLQMQEYFLSYIKPVVIPIVAFGVIGLHAIARGKFINTLSKTLNFSKMLCIISISFVLFTPISADYYLLILFLPLLIFPQMQFSFGYFFVFGLLLGAKNFIYMDHVHGNDVSWQVLINPILLLLLFLAEFDLIRFMNHDEPKLTVHESWNKETKIAAIVLFPATIILAYTMHLYSITKRATHNTEAGIPTDFDPAVFLATHPTVVALWRSKEGGTENDQKLPEYAEKYYKTSGFVGGWYESMNKRKVHNAAIDLPFDFDPSVYLLLNPQLQDFWRSIGINESGQPLLDRAELHYLSFGSKDGWKYK